MELTIAEIARIVGGTVEGDGLLRIDSVCSLEDAQPGSAADQGRQKRHYCQGKEEITDHPTALCDINCHCRQKQRG